MTPLNKDIIDALHADGYHVVTRQEWYSQQAEIGRLEAALVEYRQGVEKVRSMEVQWGNDEFIPDDKEEAYRLGYGDALVNAYDALSATAGEAVAKRMAALERVAEAARDWMDLHWDGNTPTPPDASTREWMELSFTMKDKERALKGAVKELEAMGT